MQALQNLRRNKGATKTRKRLGRGVGSGLGKTAGRGENGQKSRTGGKIRPGFAGGTTPLYRKMPKLKGFKNPNRIVFQPVNLSKLNKFEDGTEVDVIKLYEKKIINDKQKPVKILGGGEIEKKLTIKVSRVSDSAKEKIEAAGGKIIELLKEAPAKKAKKKSKETKTK